MTYLVKYFYGLANCVALVMAQDEKAARALFLETHPRLRDYNIRGIQPTAGRVFEVRK